MSAIGRRATMQRRTALEDGPESELLFFRGQRENWSVDIKGNGKVTTWRSFI
jgi:hypothetical protein